MRGDKTAKSRKYRVMFIGGALYPLHLAISSDWKVHYFTADMALDQDHRREEQFFLDDMEQALGPRAMGALMRIATQLGLNYGGIDFAVGQDGALIFFEANTTMVIVPAARRPQMGLSPRRHRPRAGRGPRSAAGQAPRRVPGDVRLSGHSLAMI